MLEIILWALSALYTPTEAAHVAAVAVGAPEMERELLRICRRESRCLGRVKVHEIDAWASHRVYKKAAKRGWVDPKCQAYVPKGWSTRGAFGLMAAYNLHKLGIPCLPPEAMDVPIVSALIAAKKLEVECSKRPEKRAPPTMRWGSCKWKKARRTQKAPAILKKDAAPSLVKTSGDGLASKRAAASPLPVDPPSTSPPKIGSGRDGGGGGLPRALGIGHATPVSLYPRGLRARGP